MSLDPCRKPWRAVIADDEPALLDYLGKCLRDAWPDLDIVGTAANGEEALDLIRRHAPDVAFLDVRMPGLSGLEVALQAGSSCALVFVTAYGDHAVEAFERAAIDYVLKPVTVERLRMSAERLTARIAGQPAGPDQVSMQSLIDSLRALLADRQAPSSLPSGQASAPRYLHWLQVSRREEVQLLPTSEVDLFQSSDKVTLIIHGKGEWVIRTALKELESQLDPDLFWRVHRNAIVRVGAIQKVEKDLQGQFVLRLAGHGRLVPVSRPYAHLFKAL